MGDLYSKSRPGGGALLRPVLSSISACAIPSYTTRSSSEMAGIEKEEAEIIGSGDEDAVSSEF